ncbi:unnamed protein product [Blepharisma stoltei]|uniref:Uncharacterized protein n=1 Tax=Blepharisma stoltei TaxID=1481888 RepID=A0AAU9J6D4_9CILI|nr:unnamed protein product [Blepharisma stoltei]
MASGSEPHFTESLFGCTKDCGVCLWGCCIPCGAQCMQGKAIEKATDGTQGCFVPCLLAICLGCIGAAINRGTVRGKFTIEGGCIGDCCTHCFCGPCAACQEYREVAFRKGFK